MRNELVTLLTDIDRTSKVEKRVFLSAIAELIEDRYQVAASSDTYEKTLCHNLYIGDVQQAEILVTTYYDTGFKMFAENYNADMPYRLKISATKRAIMMKVLYVFLGSILIYFLGTKFILNHPFSIGDTALIFVFLAYAFGRKLVTLPYKQHTVQNDSSVITLFDALEKNQQLGYVLTDYGFEERQGDKLISEILRQGGRNPFVIMLDTIGGNSELVYTVTGDMPAQVRTALTKAGITENKKSRENHAKIYDNALRIYPKEVVPLGSPLHEKGKQNMETVKTFLESLSR